MILKVCFHINNFFFTFFFFKENITELKKVNINKEKCQICNFEIIDK